MKIFKIQKQCLADDMCEKENYEFIISLTVPMSSLLRQWRRRRGMRIRQKYIKI